MRRLAVLVVVALALGGWALRAHARSRATEQRLAEVAGFVAGRPVRVRCQGALSAAVDVSPESGYAQIDQGETTLKRWVCNDIVAFTDSPATRAKTNCLITAGNPLDCPPRAEDLTQALETLAHEAVHLRGITDEAKTECYAVQTVAAVALRFGASVPQALGIASAAYLQSRLKSEEYVSPACVPGGNYDLHPDTRSWPTD